MKGLVNLNVDVQEKDGNIIFLHKIVQGSASRSYGIHVAKLAGVPSSLLERAEEKLSELEDSGASFDLEKYGDYEDAQVTDLKEEAQQISFFDFAPNPVVERLKGLDLMNITPSQAFGILEELKEAAEK